jgi:hypothetical protein
MSRRDSTIKAVAGALQPSSVDLTKLAPARIRGEGSQERARTVSSDDAAGALGFSALNWHQLDAAGAVVNEGLGNPLTAALLRLKYAEQRSYPAFVAARELLLKRHREDGNRRRPSDVMRAVAMGALMEWVHDPCPECRGSKEGAPKAAYCLSCGQSREDQQFRDGEGIWRTRSVVMGQPTAGCAKCSGLGRLFKVPEESRGMICGACGNLGVRTFSPRQRFQVVNEYIGSGRGELLEMHVFTRRWLKVYVTFVKVLQKADKKLHLSIDTQVSRMENADTVPGREEQIKEPSDESDS